MNNILRSTLAACALFATIVTATALPAKADGSSTTRTILESIAAVAIVATVINVQHKNAAANSVVGYLSNGDPVYQDGHVVEPNGQNWYPSQNGQSVNCNGNSCYLTAANNNQSYNNGYNNDPNNANNGGYNPPNNGNGTRGHHHG